MSRRTPALVLAAVLVLAGCGRGAANADGPPPAPGPVFPVTVGTVHLDKQPTHIVSLSPTATEILFEIGAEQQVTAVDDQSNYPPEAPKTDLSGFKPNAEAIAAKNPDLVVISNDTNKIMDQLAKLKIPVYLAPAAKTVDDTYRQVQDLGKLTGHTDDAGSLVDGMKDELSTLVQDLPERQRKLTYYWELDPTFYSATSKTFIGSLLAGAKLENVADPADAGGGKGGYPQLSAESVVKANPDLIFLADTKCCKQSADTLKQRPGWSGIAAVKNGRVVALDDDIASRWGPRVVDLLRTVTDAVADVPPA
jgi:iron complex transport system substrate-binding protein